MSCDSPARFQAFLNNTKAFAHTGRAIVGSQSVYNMYNDPGTEKTTYSENTDQAGAAAAEGEAAAAAGAEGEAAAAGAAAEAEAAAGAAEAEAAKTLKHVPSTLDADPEKELATPVAAPAPAEEEAAAGAEGEAAPAPEEAEAAPPAEDETRPVEAAAAEGEA